MREALLRRLRCRYEHDRGALIIEELGLRHGASRIDVAVINGRLEGFELKSAADSLQRLPSQVSIYGSVLDRATLVCDEGHLEAAMALLPFWWGVMTSKVGRRGGVRMRTVRRAKQNPTVDPLSVAKLLWRDEALHLVEQYHDANGLRSAPRRVLYEVLTSAIEADHLSALVRAQLRSRSAWRSAAR